MSVPQDLYVCEVSAMWQCHKIYIYVGSCNLTVSQEIYQWVNMIWHIYIYIWYDIYMIYEQYDSATKVICTVRGVSVME